MLRRFVRMLFNRENLLAVMLGLLLLAIFVFSIDTSPTWIYQGF